MEHAIDMYTDMIRIVFLSSLGIVLLTILIIVVMGVKRRKSIKILCTSCGKHIDKDSNFCKYCGCKQNRIL